MNKTLCGLLDHKSGEYTYRLTLKFDTKKDELNYKTEIFHKCKRCNERDSIDKEIVKIMVSKAREIVIDLDEEVN